MKGEADIGVAEANRAVGISSYLMYMNIWPRSWAEGVAVVEWLSSWLAEQMVRDQARSRHLDFRDWVSPAANLQYY